MDYFAYQVPKEKIQNDPELILIKKKKKHLSRFPGSVKCSRRLSDLVTLENLRKRQIIENHAKAFEYIYAPYDISMLMETEVFDDQTPDGNNLAPAQPSGGALAW